MSVRYADVIVDISHEKLDRPFQYRIPEALADRVVPGSQVKVPFGSGGRTVTGYVLGISGTPRFDEARIKEISGVDPDAAAVEAKLVALAAWIRETYGSTMIQALKTVLPARMRAKGKETGELVLMVSPEAARELLSEFERRKQKARARLLSALLAEQTLPLSRVTKEYRISRDAVRALEERGIVKRRLAHTWRNPVRQAFEAGAPHVLSAEQQSVLSGIRAEWRGADRPCLISGVTGSGKTEIYMELIADMLRQKRQAILLIPEIALTRQTVQRFGERFGGCVTVLHSRLTPAERADQMERARNGEVQIMIGPRSALFAPFPELGLVVIDEEHETSYQSEVTPRYHARETALARARIEGARVILGSATPSVDAYYRCRTGEFALFRLKSRYGGARLPKVWITDMREELKAGNRSILSRSLAEAIQERRSAGEQTMLFLNRRGYAGFVSCRACGHVMRCPHCAVSLTAHNNGRLVCHYCGYQRPQVTRCPSCGSFSIGGFRAGTQQIEQVVRKTFPGIRTLRLDADTVREKDGHEKILKAFGGGEADVLIGTQMIVKGHDFPNVTLVGVLAADLSLNAGDYRAGERTYALLAQAVGRAGRGEKPGMAVIQTYQPEHYSIRAAARQEYDAFFEEELAYRQLLRYPPAANLMTIHAAAQEEEHLAEAMEYIRRYLLRFQNQDGMQLIGPAEEAVAKIKDLYRRVIYVKSDHPKWLFALRDRLEQYLEINRGFDSVHIQFDFNA